MSTWNKEENVSNVVENCTFNVSTVDEEYAKAVGEVAKAFIAHSRALEQFAGVLCPALKTTGLSIGGDE